MKILAFTSIRSDYDLLSPLYRLLHEDSDIDFRLLVSGAHLSKEFGYTKEQISKDGFDILLEIETLINSDSRRSRIKTASILLQNSIDVVAGFDPDLILYAGDREDVIVAAMLGTYLQIPAIHFYGGDHEEDGHQDTYIRHASSKLSSLHFVAHEEHKKRLMAMGEPERRIFNIGSISLDKFRGFAPLDIRQFFDKNIPDEFALLIFHPVAGENAAEVFCNIIQVLKDRNIFTFVSYPNTDPGYEDINDIITKHKDDKNFIFYKNLERDLFLSIFAECEFIIGNSSAGIYEAASLKKAAINVGLRQKNRLDGKNIIYAGSDSRSIKAAIQKARSSKFMELLKDIKNPYGDGNSAKKAYDIIKNTDFSKYLIKNEDPLKGRNNA